MVKRRSRFYNERQQAMNTHVFDNENKYTLKYISLFLELGEYFLIVKFESLIAGLNMQER